MTEISSHTGGVRDDANSMQYPLQFFDPCFAQFIMYPEVDVNQPAFGPCVALLHVSLVKSRAAAEREVAVELRSLLDWWDFETGSSWSVPIWW